MAVDINTVEKSLWYVAKSASRCLSLMCQNVYSTVYSQAVTHPSTSTSTSILDSLAWYNGLAKPTLPEERSFD